MKAIILAAGASTRLHPLTLTKPKCLLTVRDKTILDYQLEALVDVGVSEVVIVVGCQKELIKEHLSEKKYPLTVTCVDNDEYATTQPILGGLARVTEHLRDPILFFHSDVLFETNALTKLLAHPADSVMLYRKDDWDLEAGKIIVAPDTQTVRELGKHIEQERSTGEYLQIAKFGSYFLKELVNVLRVRTAEGQDGFTIGAFNDVIKKGSVSVIALPFEGKVSEIDTHEDYASAKKIWETL
jgi:NDP-sugar pyrophosphorylase family protein